MTEQDYQDDEKKAATAHDQATKDAGGDKAKQKAADDAYNKRVDTDKEKIGSIEATAKKWNDAAKKEVVKATQLDDSWQSFKDLASTNPYTFLVTAGATMANYQLMLAKDPKLQQALNDAAAKAGVSPDLVLSVLTMEGRGWTIADGGSGDGLALKQMVSEAWKTELGHNPKGMNNVSVGPGQLKGPARTAAGLSVNQAETMSGAMQGTANWLTSGPNANPQIHPGYTDEQRAAVYNGGAIGGSGYRNGGQAYGVEAGTIEGNMSPTP
jgi:hypothetical protein